MLRYFVFVLFLFFLFPTAYSQYSQSENDTIITDSIVYEIDTIVSVDTIQHFVYGAPINYNVIGVRFNMGESWFNNSNHQNPQTYVSPELFCNFSRGKSLFSFGIQYSTCNERVKYNIKNTLLHDTTFQKMDTSTWYGIIQNGDTTKKYITQLNTYNRTDTLVNYTKINQNSALSFISIPLRYGYYITNGYFRINLGLGVLPTFLITKKINIDPFMLNTKKRFSLLVQPTIEISYWLFTHGFIHFSCSFQRSLVSMTINNKSNAHINNIITGIGFSFLFFDKKRE
jgi:hypothetical protein